MMTIIITTMLIALCKNEDQLLSGAEYRSSQGLEMGAKEIKWIV